MQKCGVWAASIVVAGFVVGTMAPDAEARAFRFNEIPNGPSFNCTSCHVETSGDAPRNAFGKTVEEMGLVDDGSEVSAQHVDWAAVFSIDSDGDGASNGVELGDPNGTWVIGDPDPGFEITNPGDATDIPTGDLSNGTTSNGTASNGTSSNSTTGGTTSDGSDDGSGGDDGGCSVTPGAPNPGAVFLVLLGCAVAVVRRRR